MEGQGQAESQAVILLLELTTSGGPNHSDLSFLCTDQFQAFCLYWSSLFQTLTRCPTMVELYNTSKIKIVNSISVNSKIPNISVR